MSAVGACHEALRVCPAVTRWRGCGLCWRMRRSSRRNLHHAVGSCIFSQRLGDLLRAVPRLVALATFVRKCHEAAAAAAQNCQGSTSVTSSVLNLDPYDRQYSASHACRPLVASGELLAKPRPSAFTSSPQPEASRTWGCQGQSPDPSLSNSLREHEHAAASVH